MAPSRGQLHDDIPIPDLERIFGQLLYSHRRAKGLSQEELGLRTDLARPYISRLERGLQLPTLRTLFLLAKELEIPAWELIRMVEEKVNRATETRLHPHRYE
ncbi:MAG: helix-turn-helix transcriptional regulator [Bacteroidota bacterium]